MYHRLLHWLWTRHNTRRPCEVCQIHRRLQWRAGWAKSKASGNSQTVYF